MNRQDFIALLEYPHSGEVNSAERWDQRAQSFAAMKKTYGSQLTDRVIRHLTDKQILTRDSSVIDIGCGSGRYAIPFSGHAKEVAAADISKNMLQLVAQDAQRQGITNLETLQTDWRDLSGSYDLVFASMAPVLFSMEGLEKMSALSTGFCVAARYIDMRDPILESIEKERFRKNPHLGRDQAWAIFNLLWMEGYQPEITYLERLCDAPLTMDEAMARYNIQMEDKEQLHKRLEEFTDSNGMVQSKSQTTLALIIWNVKQRRK